MGLWQRNAEAAKDDVFSSFIFFNACVQRVVNHCFPFPSFSMVLLSLKELLGLYGLCLCCVSFPCELFPASWY